MSPIRLCIPLIALALVACGGTPDGGETATTSPGATTTSPGDAAANPGATAGDPLAGVVLASPPEGATSITAVKSEVEPGQTVVLRGRIGGRVQPFIPGRAAMLVVDDQAVQACDANPDDACGTPWDFCCVAQGELAKSMATVQVVGEDGRPLASELQGIGGLAAGSHVIVSGTVAEGSGDGNLVVNASGIYPGSPNAEQQH